MLWRADVAVIREECLPMGKRRGEERRELEVESTGRALLNPLNLQYVAHNVTIDHCSQHTEKLTFESVEKALVFLASDCLFCRYMIHCTITLAVLTFGV
jgi:hypothetical protein